MCQVSLSTYHLCRGATARDPVEGDVSHAVQACKQGFAFQQFGLQACTFDSSKPGNHTLRFWVTDSALHRNVTVERTLQMLPECGIGEEHCRDGTCSTNGICSSNQGGAAISAPSNSPPQLQLLPVPGQTTALTEILVPRGWAYKACSSQQGAPTPSQPCEPGLLLSC